jgi:hypothetical protein
VLEERIISGLFFHLVGYGLKKLHLPLAILCCGGAIIATLVTGGCRRGAEAVIE